MFGDDAFQAVIDKSVNASSRQRELHLSGVRLAAGAIKYCDAAGIAMPKEVSIIGFENLEIAELTSPELTTLEVPARDMGRIAADYILASPSQRLHLGQRELAIRLIVRESTAVVRL